MKLELKHIAPYLPYGLNIMNGWGDIERLRPIHLEETTPIVFIPILRPLSDLTKEIEVNGERFVPKDVFIKANESLTSYDGVTTLIEWHFDVFGLIKNGLAIDINTLEK